METTKKLGKRPGKIFVSGLFGVLIVAAACLSCNSAIATGALDGGVIYTAEQIDGEHGVVTSTGIKLTFESEISDLQEDQIIIRGNATTGSLSGNGKVWTIGLSDVAGEGEVIVSINNANIEKTSKQVMVYKASGDALPKLVSAARKDGSTVAVKFNKSVTDANSNYFTVTKTGTLETFAVSNASASGAVVTLTLASAGSEQLAALTITITDNAVKDLNGNGAAADSIGVSISGESFKFTVHVEAGESFAIPTSGRLNEVSTAKLYDWNINWGDASGNAHETGSSSEASVGISHPYSTTNDYQITIAPNGSTDAWLGAFGFASYGDDANAQTNRDKIISVDSEITPLMTRTQAQIDGNTAPTYEWAYTFYNCKNSAFKMGDNFKFAAEWNAITTVGNYFAANMFYRCSEAAFTMSDVFNMPQGITTAGDYFANSMFDGCSGAAFTMNNIFNMPQSLTIAGDYFASNMFASCRGAVFTMGDVFNMPQNLITVGRSFANSMFNGCWSGAFTMNTIFNMPQSITTVGNSFAERMFANCSGATFTMNAVFSMPQSITTVGNSFAERMFDYCNGAAFTIGAAFNMPQGITTVGDYFASNMFSTCRGAAFTMGSVFNMPQNITTVGDSFADSMFEYCTGNALRMNAVFNMPQSITTVGATFASEMFHDCSGTAFIMNDIFKMPPLITSAGRAFASGMFAGCRGAAFTMGAAFDLPHDVTTVGSYFAREVFQACNGPNFQVNNTIKFYAVTGSDPFKNMFDLGDGAALQTRTATSIINELPAPSSRVQTFGPAGAWEDYGIIATNWKR
jgi:hypothetical protein